MTVGQGSASSQILSANVTKIARKLIYFLKAVSSTLIPKKWTVSTHGRYRDKWPKM